MRIVEASFSQIEQTQQSGSTGGDPAPTFTQTPAQAAEPPNMAPPAVTPPAVTPPPAAPPAVTPPATPSTTLTTEPPAAPATTDPAKPETPPPAVIKPEDYKITLPEGLEPTPMLDALRTAAAEKGVSPEVLQSLVDKVGPELLKQMTAPAELWKTTNEAWTAEIKADPTVGGEKLPATVARIKAAFATYGEPGLNAALDTTGAGNNPAIIRTFNRMATALTEGGAVTGGAPGHGTDMATAARTLYPSAKGQ